MSNVKSDAAQCETPTAGCCDAAGLHIEVHRGPEGASVHGVDAVKPLTAKQLRALQSALCERRMLLIYGQHLDDAQLVSFLCGLVTASQAARRASSVLYAETVPRTGSDAIWIRLASACDLLDAGMKRQIGQVQLIVYNPFLRRLRMLPVHG